MNNVVATQPAPWTTIEKLVDNARRLGKESQHVAAAAYLLRGTVRPAKSLCVWCAEKHPDTPAFRLPKGGECDACTYVGHDCLVVVADDETAQRPTGSDRDTAIAPLRSPRR